MKQFKKIDNNMVQILHRCHTKSGHWFTVSTIGCNEGSVNWYDSSYNELDFDSKYQICSILKYDGKALKFNKIPVRSQQGAAVSLPLPLPLHFV